MLKSFKDYASDTFRDIAKDAVKSFLKINLIDRYQDKLSEFLLRIALVLTMSKKWDLLLLLLVAR